MFSIKRIPREVVYIFMLFFLSRVMLTLIALYVQPNPLTFNITTPPPIDSTFSPVPWLNVWGKWDTNFYLRIVKNGYSSYVDPTNGFANYAFFPLYPLSIKLLSLTGIDPFVSALIISNISFILSGVMLFKLFRLDLNENETYHALKYLFLLPISFLFSAALSESLFLLFLILCFYFARKQRWFYTGLFGLLLTLTRSIGIVAFIPLAIEFILAKKEQRGFLSSIWLLLIPLGFFAFIYYIYTLTGSFWSIFTVQIAWGRHLTNPLSLIYSALFVITPDPYYVYYSRFIGVYITVLFGLTCYFFKQLRLSYWVLAILFLIIPTSTGLLSLLRLSLPIFPIYFILAKITKNDYLDQVLTISLALLQGGLMVAWITGSYLLF